MLVIINDGAVAEESVALLRRLCSLQGKVVGPVEMLSVSSAAPEHRS